MLYALASKSDIKVMNIFRGLNWQEMVMNWMWDEREIKRSRITPRTRGKAKLPVTGIGNIHRLTHSHTEIFYSHWFVPRP